MRGTHKSELRDTVTGKGNSGNHNFLVANVANLELRNSISLVLLHGDDSVAKQTSCGHCCQGLLCQLRM